MQDFTEYKQKITLRNPEAPTVRLQEEVELSSGCKAAL